VLCAGRLGHFKGYLLGARACAGGDTTEVQRVTRQNRARNWFVLSFFILGATLPLVLMTLGSVARTGNAGEIEGHTTTAQWLFLWVIWPTWILMLDAEHSGTFVFVLVLAAALNGLWYAGAAIVFWYAGAELKRLGGWGT
jgi:hypothetical protein